MPRAKRKMEAVIIELFNMLTRLFLSAFVPHRPQVAPSFLPLVCLEALLLHAECCKFHLSIEKFSKIFSSNFLQNGFRGAGDLTRDWVPFRPHTGLRSALIFLMATPILLIPTPFALEETPFSLIRTRFFLTTT